MSLEDLKRALEAVHKKPNIADYGPPGEDKGIYDNHMAAYHAARAEAWKAAFEWRIGFRNRWRAEDILIRERDIEKWTAEENEGMRLIREKLA